MDPRGAPPSAAAQSPARRHWQALLLLTLGVVLAHVWLTYEVSSRMENLAAGPGIERMEATYVSEVKLSAPPVAVASVRPAEAPPIAAPVARKRNKKAPKPPKAASAPDDAASDPPPPPQEAASAVVAQAEPDTPPLPEPPTSAASSALPASAPEAAMAVAASASAPPPAKGPTFIWPKATKVRYKLEGNFRGPFYGTAYVEWIRQDNRYQVHMEASSGILGSTHMTSEGLITPRGLSPQRYESVNRRPLLSPKVNSLRFEEDVVVLQGGERQSRMQDMQDPVSQLIHLAYRFISNPDLLKPGNTVELPIAWTKRTEVIAYDVIKEEMLATAIGEINTLHVKPRRVVKDKDNISGEIWFAPGLQYLPVRIHARMGEDITLDMRLDGAPQQTPGDAEPPTGNSSAGTK